jgi:HSP20 family protein
LVGAAGVALDNDPEEGVMSKKSNKEAADAVEKVPHGVVGWDPFERFGVADIFGRWPSWLGSGLAERLAEIGDMKLEEFRDNGALVIRAELPGVDPDEDIEISVDNGRLSIRATREQRTSSDENGYRSEFRYGSFSRVVSLPEGADPEAVTANYADGILEVRVPIDEAKSSERRVAVTRG